MVVKSRAVPKVAITNGKSLTSTRRKTQRTLPRQTTTEPDEEEDADIFFEVHSFQELQRATGSEILDDELQLQIDKGSKFPDMFLDAHMSDASYMEKVAMSSIPEQLPKPAVNAMRKVKALGLNKFASRVSPEEEIELAKMIQKGAKLHRLKADFEADHGRKPSKSEWAKLAALESPTQLRRVVADYRRAKQLLVSANMGLVYAVVRTQYNMFKRMGMSFEEVVQEGSLGLLRAAELFDPSRGLRFSTYATIWIKGTLSNSHMNEPIKLPQRDRTKYNKIVKAYKEITESNGGSEPTIEEVASQLGMKVSEVLETKKKMGQAKQILSLDYEYKTQSRSGGESGSLNKLESDKAFMADTDLAERTQMQADVVAAMARNLDAREARLMRLRYGLSNGNPRTLYECAEAMGLSYTRVQNIASKCLKKMREAADAESLEEYLLTIA
jgi:RNA polymerase primary sigma factor